MQDLGFDLMISGDPKTPLKSVSSGNSRQIPKPALQPQRLLKRTPKPAPPSSPRRPRPTPDTATEEILKKVPAAVSQRSRRGRADSSSKTTQKDPGGSVVKKRRVVKKASVAGTLNPTQPVGEITTATQDLSLIPPEGILTSGQGKDKTDNVSIPKDAPLPPSGLSKRRKKRKPVNLISRKKARNTPPNRNNDANDRPLSMEDSNIMAERQQPEHEVRMSKPSKLVSDDLAQTEAKGEPKKRERRMSFGRSSKAKQKLSDIEPPSSRAQGTNVVDNNSENLAQGTQRSARLSRKRLALVEEAPEDQIKASVDQETKPQPHFRPLSEPRRPRGRPRKLPTESEPQQVLKPNKNPPPLRKPRTLNPPTKISKAKKSTDRPPKKASTKTPTTIQRAAHDQFSDDDDEDVLAGPAPVAERPPINANDLDTLIQDLEGAVQKGRAQQALVGDGTEETDMAALESSLRHVASKAISLGQSAPSGKLRELNTFLTRSVAVS